MFELADFYDYCKENSVDVIPFSCIPSPGATVRDGEHLAIFLDFTKIKTVQLLRGVCCHEMGHVATGSLHKVSSPYELVERSEYRANRYVARNFLTADAFRAAFAAGYTEPWQLAEYFDLPEQDIKKALSYWSERRGIDFNT